MAHQICLHPDLIDEVIEDLFAVNVISNDQIRKLKVEAVPDDPNIVMDVRHKEVKKESLIDFDVARKAPETVKGTIENKSKGVEKKVKDLKTVDKEICNTRKCLELFQNKLEVKNEDLKNSISILERELNFETKFEENSHCDMRLNEQETIDCFNLHLDRLESDVKKPRQKNYSKIWRPTEQTSPLINVITTLKDVKAETLQNVGKELKFFPNNDFMQCYITRKSFQTSPEIQVNQMKSRVLIVSPISSVDVLDDRSRLTPKYQKNILKVINTWKSYVKKRKVQKWSKEKTSQLKKKLLQKYLSYWISYSKKVRSVKNLCLRVSSNENLEIMKENWNINQKMIELADLHVKAENGEVQNQINIDKVQVKLTEKHEVEKRMDNNMKITSKWSKGKCLKPRLENTPHKTEIHMKTITFQDVELIQMENTSTGEVYEKRVEKQAVETNNNSLSSRSLREPIIHRFEAQEKIIKQQKEVIEKQSRVIFDLKAKCFELESKLNCTLAERELKLAEAHVTKDFLLHDNKQEKMQELNSLRPITHKRINNIKGQDKCDIIVKNMVERHAYCSQLAEQTKLRKKRIEEERQRIKIENEEKQKQEKEEEKRNRLKQKRLEQQLAEEKERNAIASMKIEAALLEIASNHYLNTLLRRTFNRLKLMCIEVKVKYEDCDKIYRRKILRSMFNIWREKVKVCLKSRCKFAERFYNEKLLRMALGNLCKMYHDYKLKQQVSEDLYSLKLKEKMFQHWKTFVAQQVKQYFCQIELAERFYRRHLLRHSLHQWKELPRLMLKYREREQRRQAWRYSVKQLIPDFTPAYEDEM